MPKTLTKLYNPQSDLKEEQAHKNETVHDFTKFVNCNEVMGYALLCQKHHVKHVGLNYCYYCYINIERKMVTVNLDLHNSRLLDCHLIMQEHLKTMAKY